MILEMLLTLLNLSIFIDTYLFSKFEFFTILCQITLFEHVSNLFNFDNLTTIRRRFFLIDSAQSNGNLLNTIIIFVQIALHPFLFGKDKM